MEHTKSSLRFKSLIAFLLALVFLASRFPPNECRYLRRNPIKRYGEIAGSWNEPAWDQGLEEDFSYSDEDGMGRTKRVGRACGSASNAKLQFFLRAGCPPGRSKLCECVGIGTARCGECQWSYTLQHLTNDGVYRWIQNKFTAKLALLV